MFNIADYLKKFSRIEDDSLVQKNAVSSVIFDVCGARPDFEVRKGVVFIKGSSAMKSIVYIKKDAVLNFLKEKYPRIKITDIR